jgi:two-component system, OmpR family, response regulator
MKKIFVIEDNDANYMLVEEILSYYKVEVIRAKDGKEFYSKMAIRPVEYDLILMDLMLPDTDGISLTKYLINEKYKIPIVFISAYTEKCEEIFDLGVEYFINKPVMEELFISIVKKHIELNEVEQQ